MPPQRIWNDSEGLEEWWDLIQERREARMSGGRGPSLPGSDDSDEMTGNDLARAFREQ